MGGQIKELLDYSSVMSSNNIQNDTIKLDTSLVSTRSIEDEYKEQQWINLAENWLNNRGIETRDNTYEHNLLQSWKIMLDFGKYLEVHTNV